MLEIYTFLTSKMAVSRPNVYAGRKRQFVEGISNVHQLPPSVPSNETMHDLHDQGHEAQGGDLPRALHSRVPAEAEPVDQLMTPTSRDATR
jgi:hypothetical protein